MTHISEVPIFYQAEYIKKGKKKKFTAIKLIGFSKPPYIGDWYSIRTVKPRIAKVIQYRTQNSFSSSYCQVTSYGGNYWDPAS